MFIIELHGLDQVGPPTIGACERGVRARRGGVMWCALLGLQFAVAVNPTALRKW
jgi:hypothetical protein